VDYCVGNAGHTFWPAEQEGRRDIIMAGSKRSVRWMSRLRVGGILEDDRADGDKSCMK
jgi:hypothetical protein